MVTQPRWLRASTLVAVTTLISAAFVATATAPAEAAAAATNAASLPETVSSTALPTVQVDGVVWAQVVVGNTVYVGGDFANAQPAGAAAGVSTTARANMLAYNLQTGALITSFNPGFNSQVRGLVASPDGSRIYAVGSFTKAGGVLHDRIAAINASTGAVISSFAPDLNAQAYSVAVSGSTVYAGGQFTTANGVTRTRVAAFSATDGSVTAFAPTVPDHAVRSILVAPQGDKVLLAGDFLTLNGGSDPGYGMGMVDAATGQTNLTWNVNHTVRNAGDKAAIWSLSTDGTNVYGSGYVAGGGGGNLEGVFKASWSDGTVGWIEDCHGDTYDTTTMSGVLYEVGHSHECETLNSYPQTDPNWHFQRSLAYTVDATGTVGANQYGGYTNWQGQPAPTQLGWYPDIAAGTVTGQAQGAWTATSSNGYLLLGGEFPTINGTRQTGLVRFATRAIAPDTDGPRVSGASFGVNVQSRTSGSATVSWRSDYDRDDANLTYQVYRNGNTTTPAYSTTGASRIWFDRPAISWTDTGLTPGATYSYRLKVIDPSGNAVWSNTVSVAVARSVTPISPYDSAVLSDGAANYWRLADKAGATQGTDSAGADNLSLQSGVTFGADGSLSTGTAASFDGTQNGLATDPYIAKAPDTFSIEAWFKTTSTSGGKIVGYGSNSGSARTDSVNSSSYDRHIMMSSDGHVTFGVYTGATQTITTAKALNDGQWHYAVGTLGANGMQFFVDGKLVGSRADVTAGQPYYGYWRIGGDSLWVNASSNYFAGSIDDVAVYPTQLAKATVQSHWAAAGNTVATLPTDAYAKSVNADSPSSYWRLDESSGATTAADSSGNDVTGTYSGGVTLGQSSALQGGVGTSAAFDGSSGALSSDQQIQGPSIYSEELWFKTTTTSGGKLIGFGDQQTGTSGSYDRQVWMTQSGQLDFGAYTGNTNIASSTAAYNDGKWHQVVATQGSNGMQLYVDGALVGSNGATGQQAYSGYWRVGGDNLDGWSDGSRYFSGTIDEVSIYGSVLSADRVAAHYAAGSSANTPPVASFTQTASGLTVAFDGSGSADADGTVASYAWDFGDGTTSTLASPSHTYATAGDKTVTLTVTDDKGATGSLSKTATVAALNQPPVAAFSSSVSGLTVAFDGTGSKDPDGTISSYAWDFGDGTASSDVSPNHTFTAAGDKSVTLTVTDDDGASASVTHVVTAVTPNQAPTASFTSAVSGLSVAFDGSGSKDSDGTVKSYDWDYGDGSAHGSGVSPSHTYATAGDKSVTLTVTDDGGLTGTVTKTVSTGAVVVPPTSDLAKDGFGRTVSGGFGTADTGGAWSLSGSASSFSVGSGAGSISTAKGATLTASLGSVSSSDTDVTATFTVPQLPVGGNGWAGLVARSVGSDDYSGIFTITPAGLVSVQALHGKTSLKSATASGVRLAAGSVVHLRVQAVGTGTTAINVRFWPEGTAEPSTWQVSTTDTTTALQTAGGIGIRTYSGSAVTNGPTVFKVDDLLADPSTGGPVGPPNQAPTASFTSAVSGLSVAFDGSGSKDSDGTVKSYDWDYGDGSAHGSGVSPSHTYATAGDKSVTLTVTDDGGLTGTVTKTVSTGAVVVPPTSDLAKDGFGRTVSGGFGTADTGGAWSLSGSASSFSVGSGAGSISTAKGATLTASLGSVSSSDTDVTATFTVPQLPVGGNGWAGLVARSVGSDDYSGIFTITPTGAVSIQALHGKTALKSATVSGVKLVAGSVVHLRVQAVGTGTTTVRARVWLEGTTEPTVWQASASDTTAALQTAGAIGVRAYLGTAATNGPLLIKVDDLLADPS